MSHGEGQGQLAGEWCGSTGPRGARQEQLGAAVPAQQARNRAIPASLAATPRHYLLA